MFDPHYCIWLYPAGGSNVELRRKGRETLLQVKQRQTRELRLRTEAKCAELLGETQQGRSRHQYRPEPVSICLCCVCQEVNQFHNLTAHPQSATPQQDTSEYLQVPNHRIYDDEVPLSQEDIHIHSRFKEWALCTNVSCFLLILVAINCLILQFIWLHKANSNKVTPLTHNNNVTLSVTQSLFVNNFSLTEILEYCRRLAWLSRTSNRFVAYHYMTLCIMLTIPSKQLVPRYGISRQIGGTAGVA